MFLKSALRQTPTQHNHRNSHNPRPCETSKCLAKNCLPTVLQQFLPRNCHIIVRYLFGEVSSHPKWHDTTHPLVLSFTQAHLCETPFATYPVLIVPYPRQVRKGFAILLLQVSGEMKIIATGPLRSTTLAKHCKMIGAPLCASGHSVATVQLS